MLPLEQHGQLLVRPMRKWQSLLHKEQMKMVVGWGGGGGVCVCMRSA